MEFSRPEYWSGQPFPSPGDLPNPGINPGLLHCRHILTAEPQGKPSVIHGRKQFLHNNMSHKWIHLNWSTSYMNKLAPVQLLGPAQFAYPGDFAHPVLVLPGHQTPPGYASWLGSTSKPPELANSPLLCVNSPPLFSQSPSNISFQSGDSLSYPFLRSQGTSSPFILNSTCFLLCPNKHFHF